MHLLNLFISLLIRKTRVTIFVTNSETLFKQEINEIKLVTKLASAGLILVTSSSVQAEMS